MNGAEPHVTLEEPTFVARFLLDAEGDTAATVANVDVFVDLPDGSSWSLTIFTVDEVRRLLTVWRETGEAANGSYFWVSDQVIVPEPGLEGMMAAIRRLVRSGDLLSVGTRSVDRPSRQRADEPYESRDRELGDILRSWTEANTSSLSVELEGPFDSAGMDPTWLLRMSGELLDAEVCLFYGPRVDVAAFLPRQPADGIFVGGADGVTGLRLVEMLDELARVNDGEAMPGWLRSPPP